MLKSYQKELLIVQKLLDTFIVVAAWGLAYFTRFQTFHAHHLWYLKYAFLLLLIQYYFFRKLGLYESLRLKPSTYEMFAALRANVVVLVTFVLCVYFFSSEKISRAVIINYALYSSVLITLEKALIRNFLRYSRTKGKNLRHLVLIGSGTQTEAYIKAIGANPETGINIQGWIDSNGKSSHFKIPEHDTTELDRMIASGIDYLVIGYAFKDFSKVTEILEKVSGSLVNVSVLPDLSLSLIGHEITEFAGLPVINLDQPNLTSRAIIAKRSFDFIFSLFGLLIVSPLLFLIAIGVKLSSPGPIFFGQKRIGLDGKEFCMWKFRSMRVDAESKGAGWTTENDPRRTSFGTFLRRSSLDELPQLWNVLMGHMSLVGPRPEQPFFVHKFKSEIPAYMLRHKMKAGITGWAQVNGWRGDTSIRERIECDIWYIRNWSLWLDIQIILMTLWKGFRNAY